MNYLFRITVVALFGILIQTLPATGIAELVLVDFGSNGQLDTGEGLQGGATSAADSLSRQWNNVHDSSSLSLFSTTGSGTSYSIRLQVFDDMGIETNNPGFNNSGTSSPTGSASTYPATATEDSFFGNTSSFGGGVRAEFRITLSGLSASELYDLSFFASRLNAGDNRETEYSIASGSGTNSVFLNPSNNTGTTAGLAGLTADGNGEIVVTVSPGANNNNGFGFFYLGTLELNSTTSVPEPGSGLLFIVGMAPLFHRRRFD